MDRDSILVEVFNDDLYKSYSAKFYPHLVDEMVSELIFSLSTLSTEKLQQLHFSKEIRYYSIAVIRNMVSGKNKPFIKNFVNDNLQINEEALAAIENDEGEQLYSDVDILLNDVKEFLKERSGSIEGYWYDERLFNMHFDKDEPLSYRTISKKTDIPVSSIYHSVKKTQDLVSKEFKNRYNDVRDE